MKKRRIVFVTLVLLFFIFCTFKVDAYGFGIKKNANHEQPDIGFYKQIIEENGGIYVGDKSTKSIYLTFDCGYENGYTEKILDVLKKRDVCATFFLTGHYLDSAKDIVLRMKEEGHVLANHSNKHKNITLLSEKEIKEEVLSLEEKYYSLTGASFAPFFRPPAGNFDARSLKVIESIGYRALFWSVAYRDWNRNESVDYVVNEVCESIHPGAIILLHAVSESNALALDEIITRLQQEGYSFHSTLELLTGENISW